MQEDQSIMRYESILPEDFDGTFPFSNSSKEDFIGKWGGKEYLFPAESTVNLVMSEHSPIEVQHIRKKFARDFAEREFYKSKGYRVFAEQEGTPGNRRFNSIHQAATYTLKDLEPFIQSCLKPLTVSKLLAKEAPKENTEEKIHRKEDGSLTSEAISKNDSLRKKALES
jgi:hypothetical protein